MLEQNWKTPSTKKHLSEIIVSQNDRNKEQFGPIIPLYITKELKKLITYFCQEINRVEWSGILFYEVKGSIRNIKKMKIIAHDIHIMNKGTAAYTEFQTDPSIVSYMMKNPHLLKMKQGLIHSHNTMDTFFSAEDNDELQQTAGDHNIYLSLIVNNFGQACAKVAWVGEAKYKIKPKYQCRDQDGEYYILPSEEKEVTEKVLFKASCEVISPTAPVIMEQKYVDRLKFVETKAASQPRQVAAPQQFQPQQQRTTFQPANAPTQQYRDFRVNPSEAIQQTFDAYIEELTVAERFNCFVMRLGNSMEDGDTLQDTVDDVAYFKMDVQSMKAAIINNYPAFYEKFYGIEQESIDPKGFAECIDFLHLQLSELNDETQPVPIIAALLPTLSDYAAKVRLTNQIYPNEPRTIASSATT